MAKNQEKKWHGINFLAGALVGIIVTGSISLVRIESMRQKRAESVVPEESGTDAAENTDAGSAVNAASVKKLRSLEDIIDGYYYGDKVSQGTMEDGLYHGLMDSLGDVYSVYYDADEWKEMNAQTEGVYYGIGATVSLDKTTGYPVIVRPMDGSAAQDAGLLEGDLIYKVDGQDLYGMSLEEAVALIRGEEGTKVTLTIVRDGGEPTDYEITRRKFDAQVVYYEMKDDKIGYIGIVEFDDVTTSQFENALNDLESQGMQGLIIDLRGNPGGNVSTVTAIAEMLLPKGLIFYYEDKDGRRTEYNATGEHEFTKPLAVLVNGYSASASEILSGAIQDAGIGTIIGTQTYGKGVVQSIVDLKDGTAVKITIAGYFTRNGRDINHKGITPDEIVELDTEARMEDGTDNQLDAAMENIRKKLAAEK